MARGRWLGFNRRRLLLGLVFTLLFCAVVISSLFFKGYFKEKELPSDVVIAKVMMLAEAKDYEGWPATAIPLRRDQQQKKAEQYPLIYGDLSGDVYEVRFSQGDGGVLLLYDARGDKILSKFNLLEWKQ